MDLFKTDKQPVAHRSYGDEVNIAVQSHNLENGDIEDLFGPGEHTNLIPSHWGMAELLVALCLFPSRGEAKRNGWLNKPIPWGWSELEVGKIKRRLFIWNPQHKASDFADCEHPGCTWAPCKEAKEAVDKSS